MYNTVQRRKNPKKIALKFHWYWFEILQYQFYCLKIVFSSVENCFLFLKGSSVIPIRSINQSIVRQEWEVLPWMTWAIMIFWPTPSTTDVQNVFLRWAQNTIWWKGRNVCANKKDFEVLSIRHEHTHHGEMAWSLWCGVMGKYYNDKFRSSDRAERPLSGLISYISYSSKAPHE